jgi:4'-phosphopantetheinyl transferase
MSAQPLAVNFWPDCLASAAIQQNLFVFAVRTPQSTLRAEARKLVRTALVEILAARLACLPEDIVLISTPGQALKLSHPFCNIGLSLSHESGLSVVAVNMHGKVGVDLMLNSSAPVGAEMLALAHDYLGAEQANKISELPEAQQNETFIGSWVSLEARLKCLENDLIEWSATREQSAHISVCMLGLPKGYSGAIATVVAE